MALAATFVVGAFSLLFRLGEAKSLGSHEGYAIVPAREMLLSGDYVVPRFGELPRLKKPPLIYWAVIASAKLTGGLTIASARLPAALAGLLLGGLMARWASRWYGGVAAVGAAAAQLTSVYVLVFARKVEADMILVLLIAAALYLLVEQTPGESRRESFFRWAGIWACAAVSWLGKFHFGPAMILVPAIAWIVLERRWRSLFGLLNPVGLLLFAAAVVIWPALVLQRLPEAWQIWQEETIGRAVGELGRQPVWFYLPHLVTWTLPWTIFALLAWPASWRDAFGHLRPTSGAARRGLAGRIDELWRSLVASGAARERFLWIWLGVTFAIVTVSANKHPHYILPALPAFSLWTGRRFAQLAEQAREGRPLLSRGLAAVLTVGCVAAAVVPIVFAERLPADLPRTALFSMAAVAATGLAATGWLLAVRRNRSAAGTALGTWVVAYGLATASFIPQTDHRIGAYRFAEEARRSYGPTAEIGVYGMDQDAAVWYLGEPVFRAETAEELAARLHDGGRLRLLTIADHKPALAALGKVRVVERFADLPGLPTVELGHYRQMVLVELTIDDPTASLPSEPHALR